MNQRSISWLVVSVMLCGAVPAALAAEQAAPTSSTSTPTPQIMSAEGTVAALDLQSQAPSLQLTAADGKVWSLSLDPQATLDRKSTRLNSSHSAKSRMPSSA